MGNRHSSHTCPVSDTNGPDIQPILGSLTWHTLSTIIAGATGLFSILVAIFLILRHANHFSNPPEQRQIIRIISIVPSFAIISFLCVWQDGSPAPYIVPGRDVAEALPMAAFFLLMSIYIAPDERTRESFFDRMALLDKMGTSQDGGSLAWYHKLAFGVLQWVPVSIILWIATAISIAAKTFCSTSNSVHFAHIWLRIIGLISTVIAISSILRFYGRSKVDFRPRGVLKQLICFKLIVVLNFLQTAIFSFMISSNDLHASKYFTFNDLANGLPSLILSCEMALIAPFFLVAYSIKPYKLGHISSPENPSSRHDMQHYQGGLFGIYALLQAANIFEIFTELLQGVFKTKFRQSPNQDMRPRGQRGYVAAGSMPFDQSYKMNGT